jgi:membrane peptidoglycan carboxypeptidase
MKTYIMADNNLDPHQFTEKKNELFGPSSDATTSQTSNQQPTVSDGEQDTIELVDPFTGEARTIKTTSTGDELAADGFEESSDDPEVEVKTKPAFLDNKPDKKGLAWVIWEIRAFMYRRRKLIRRVALGFAAFFLLSGIAVGAWLFQRYQAIADIEARATSIDEGSIVYDRNDEEIFRFYDSSLQREVVPGDQIPEEMKGAIVALEDENFYSNQVGIPWWNMTGAASKCLLSRGNNCRGGSGLSQQLVKNVTGNDARSVNRKIDELLTAVKFNQEIADTPEAKQDKVLELYLNWVPFGRNTYGVQSASRSYFGHDVNSGDLSIPESCYLASMVQRPSTFAEAIRLEIYNRENPNDPIDNPNWEVLEGRKNACIDKMFELDLKNYGTEKFIETAEQRDILKEEVVVFQKNTDTTLTRYGHIRNYLITELDEKLGVTEKDLATQGYQVYTSFDKTIQDETQSIVSGSVESRIAPNGGNNAAALVLDGSNGGIVAMVGSVDFSNDEIGGQVNVTTSARQPGSSYKPYVYASAFESGFNPGTVVLDVSTDFGQYRPANFSRTTSGITNIRTALQNSLNIPAVKSAYLSQGQSNLPNTGQIADLSLQADTSATAEIVKFAKQAGVEHPFEEQCPLSTALGGCEVEMMSHVNGINTLLQEGNYYTPNPFRSVLDQEGNDVYAEVVADSDPYPSQESRVEPAIARQITDVMSDYDARSPGVWGAGRFNLQLEGWNGANSVAAKTGTTNDVKDTWTVGGSPYFTVGVWVGNTDGTPMNRFATSSGTAAPIWNDIMTLTHDGLEKRGFLNDGLQQVSIDPQTGLLVEEGGVTEVVTSQQLSFLNQANERLSDPSYNPRENSIFQNRTPVVQRTLQVSTIDQLLIPADVEYPTELIEEVVCRDVISFFPLATNWLQPVEEFAAGLGEEFAPCPTEFTEVDPSTLTLELSINLFENDDVPDEINIEVTSQLPDLEVETIEFTIIGTSSSADPDFDETLTFNQQSSVTIDAEELVNDYGLDGEYDITIKVVDSNGDEIERTFEGVDFSTAAANANSSSSSSSSSSNPSSSSSSSSTSSSVSSSSSTSSST